MSFTEGRSRRTLRRIFYMSKLLVALVRLYQITLGLFMGGRCRFHPSCSNYAIGCLEAHGALRGSLLSAKRLCKCHPFHPGGYDPPPPRDLGDREPAPKLETTSEARAA